MKTGKLNLHMPFVYQIETQCSDRLIESVFVLCSASECLRFIV